MLYNPLLDSFIKAAESGSISKAAEKLYISPTALMKQINQLEKQLDIKLFERSHSGIKLTEAGAYIFEESKKLRQKSERILKEAYKLDSSRTRTIRIGSSYLSCANIVTDIWSNLAADHLEFRIEIVPFLERDPNDFRRSFGRDFDIICGSYTSYALRSQSEYIFLKETPFTVAMRKDHPLSGKDSLSIQDLFGFTLMIGESTEGSKVDEAVPFLRKYSEINLEFIPPHYDMSTFNKAAGTDKLLLSLPQWRNIHPSLVTKNVDWEISNELNIMCRKSAEPYVKDFMRLIRDFLEENPGYEINL